tara:strand:+ start:8704 stop:10206 length:1503 start_codon:yes stop_codon:yes gene_type:complete
MGFNLRKHLGGGSGFNSGSGFGVPVGGGATPFADLYSVLLDGVDEYINIDGVQTALSGTSQGTISFWWKPVDATPLGFEVLMSFGDTNASTVINAYVRSTTGLLTISSAINGISQFNLTTDLAAFSTGVWSHVCLVQDGISPKIYIDGSLVPQTFSVTTDKTIWFSGMAGLDNGRIGSRNINNGGETLYSNGNFDDIVFTSDAKTLAQVQNIYNGGLPKDEAAISNGVSYFKIDGDIVNTCNDSIGSNNGTYVNVEQIKIELDTPYIFNLPTALHEWYGVNASISGSTMTQPDTGSIGGLTLINPTASQIPTFSSIGSRQSALSDGVDDILQDAIVNDFRGSDTSGVMHFVFRTPSSLAANNNILFSVSKSAATTDRFFLFVIGGVVRIIVSSGGINTLIGGATSLSTNTDYIFSVYSDGSLLKGFLGTTLQFNAVGASGIRWFGDIAGTTTGLELLSREIGNANYLVSNQGYVCYTPYISDAAVLSDQLLIANEFGITV